MPGALAASYHQLVGVDSQAFDIISMAGVVSLALLLHVEQHHYGCYEVHYLAGR